MKTYPDVSELLALKAERRQRLAMLSPVEKMEIADRLRQMSKEISKSSITRLPSEKSMTVKARR